MQTLTDTKQIGNRLRERRKHLKLTQLELSELAGVSLRFIHDLETGKPSVQLSKVIAVATTLGLEFDLTMRGRPPSS